MRNSSKAQLKQSKTKESSEAHPDPDQLVIQAPLACKIPRNKFHATSLSYIASKASNRDDIVFFAHWNPHSLGPPQMTWEEKGIKLDRVIKNAGKAPRVHKWKGFNSFDLKLAPHLSTPISHEVFGHLDLSEFKHVKSFTFDPTYVLDDHHLQLLALSIRRSLLNIQRLSLSFSYALGIHVEGLKMFMDQIYQHCPRLHDLTLCLSNNFRFVATNISDPLFKIVKRLGNVKKPKLLFVLKNDQISDDLMHKIGMGLSNYFANIQELEFILRTRNDDYGPIRNAADQDQGKNSLESLTDQLAKITSLKKLTFFFHWKEIIADKNVAYLGQQISTHLTNLESLSLTFVRCSKLTGKGIKKFEAELCKGSVNLRQLNLTFKLCDGILPRDYQLVRKNLQKKLTECAQSFTIDSLTL